MHVLGAPVTSKTINLRSYRGSYTGTQISVREAIKAGVGAGAGAIRIKEGALLFLSNYTRRFAHVIKDGFNQSVDYIIKYKISTEI